MENKILKPKDLIKGYWYVGKSGDSWLFKFSHLNVRRVWHTVCGTPIDGWRSSTDGFLLDLTNIREATEKEVKKLFPQEIYTNKSMKTLKQEIEYYKVIKAFPGAKVGNKLREVGDEWVLDTEDSSLFYTQKEVEDKIYFKPIYREKITFKIGHHNVEFPSKGKIKIGCSEYTVADVKACLKVLKLSRATYISFEGNIVNKEIIDKILSRMK